MARLTFTEAHVAELVARLASLGGTFTPEERVVLVAVLNRSLAAMAAEQSSDVSGFLLSGSGVPSTGVVTVDTGGVAADRALVRLLSPDTDGPGRDPEIRASLGRVGPGHRGAARAGAAGSDPRSPSRRTAGRRRRP